MKIKQISEMLSYLPTKDIPIAEKLLSNRDFVELKALVDSDVYKAEKKKDSFVPSTEEEITTTYEELEQKCVNLEQLQLAVDSIANVFLDMYKEKEEYYIPDYDW